MEKFTLEMKEFFNRKLELYKELNRIVKKERDSIIKMDTAALWKSSEEKKKIALSIESVRGKILKSLEEKSGRKDETINPFSLSYLVRTIPVSKDMRIELRKIKFAIENEKNELTRVALENKKYVQEYLCFIDDIMSVVVDNSRHAQYNFSGTMPGVKNINRLIHAQV
ncbi:MAG: flagellar export chaperone FlgN [Desulfobacula sp.]